jgi:hypothetical protein
MSLFLHVHPASESPKCIQPLGSTVLVTQAYVCIRETIWQGLCRKIIENQPGRRQCHGQRRLDNTTVNIGSAVPSLA